MGNGTQEVISAIRQGGVRKRNGGGGREGGVPPSPHHATLGTVHRLQFVSLVWTIMKVEFKQDSRISIRRRKSVI